MAQFCRKCGEPTTCVRFGTDIDDPSTWATPEIVTLPNGEECQFFALAPAEPICITDHHCFAPPHCLGTAQDILNGQGNGTVVDAQTINRIIINAGQAGSGPVTFQLVGCSSGNVFWTGTLPAGSTSIDVPANAAWPGGMLCLVTSGAPEDGSGPIGVSVNVYGEICFPPSVIVGDP